MSSASDSRIESQPAVRPVAVIDIGTTSIRMAIAEIDEAGGVRKLETLTQAVALGKDAFTEGSISKSTIEECVQVLKKYRRLLTEYQVTSPSQIRVVATSAVREARNRLAFADRVYVATGIEVDPLDEAEVNRITYLGVQPFLQSDSALASSRSLVMEVGGGSTELLVVKGGNVAYSNTYRLGSLRMRKTLERYRAPAIKIRDFMENQIQQTVDQIREHVPSDGGPIELIALGGDVRFAVSQLLPEWNSASLARLPLGALEQFTDHILKFTEDELVQRYHVSFPDAETLGPALLSYVQVAQAYELTNVLVTNTNLRDGLLKEMALKEVWSEEFNRQIIRSAVDLGRRYDFDEAHARHVADLARELFQQLQDEHHLDRRYEILLYVAALLHEIGQFVSHRSYHKHSMYLIQNSDIFGLSQVNLLLVSLVSRYHRRASPQPSHEGYVTLDREKRVAVAKMAALLRLADSLDGSRSQRIKEFRCRIEPGRLVISVPRAEDMSLEQIALREKGPLFEEIFGLQVLLRPLRT